MIYLAEEGRAAAKDAAPEGTTPQEMMRLGAALWKKMSAKQKAPWEKRSAGAFRKQCRMYLSSGA